MAFINLGMPILVQLDVIYSLAYNFEWKVDSELHFELGVVVRVDVNVELGNFRLVDGAIVVQFGQLL